MSCPRVGTKKKTELRPGSLWGLCTDLLVIEVSLVVEDFALDSLQGKCLARLIFASNDLKCVCIQLTYVLTVKIIEMI